MTLLSNWDENTVEREGMFYNDIWGYVDSQNNEYAIVGSPTKIQFIDVTNPTNPSLVDLFLGGASTIWRDFKTYKQYAYAVADEGSEGLIIFDLSDIHNGNITKVYQQNNIFNKAHNIYVDPPNGRLYVAGSDTRYNGLIIYDLKANPANPPVIANIDLPGEYVHDIFVLNNIAYSSHGYNGLYVYDFANASNPINLASIVTGGYNHSSWINEDRGQLIYAEEVPEGRPLGLLNLTGVNDNDLEITSTFRFPLISNDNNVTYHNPYIVDNYAFISSYNDGVVVLDISDPNNPQRVAYYDTYPSNTSYGGYNGCWGVYPFLPSGNIIASDTENGLFVLSTSITTSTDCGNGILDDFELEEDCGGFCAPCLEAPTCSDGIQNGNETGIDCGGPDCLACSTSYCGSQGEDDTFEFIARVELGSINNPTGSSGGYSDYTSLNTNLDINSTTTITLTPGFQETTYTEYWRVWIDYNQDGDFTDVNELVYNIGMASENVTTGTITVPSNALEGATRMRVSMKYYDANNDNVLPEPCSSYNYGEVEDYTITIVSNTSCSDGLQNGNETGIDCGGNCPPCSTCDTPVPTATVISGGCVKIDWAAIADATEYKCRYRMVGGSWIEYTAKFDLSFLNNLTVGSSYQFQVKSKCDGLNSVWSPSITFTTATDDCDRPNTVTVGNITATSCLVSWSQDTDDLKYKVGYKKAGTSGWTQIFVDLPNTSRTISGLTSGADYKARVKTKCSGGWTNWSPKEDFTTLSSFGFSNAKIQEENILSIYPNPVNQIVYIDYILEADGDVNIQVFDILGKSVIISKSNQTTGPNTIQVDVSQLISGNYYLRIQSGNQQIVKKFVKL